MVGYPIHVASCALGSVGLESTYHLHLKICAIFHKAVDPLADVRTCCSIYPCRFFSSIHRRALWMTPLHSNIFEAVLHLRSNASVVNGRLLLRSRYRGNGNILLHNIVVQTQ
jgi:hypothetical protein